MPSLPPRTNAVRHSGLQTSAPIFDERSLFLPVYGGGRAAP